MPNIYINYVITSNRELLISSYHDKVQSKANALPLAKSKDKNIKPKDLQQLEEILPQPFDDGIVKTKLLNLLATIEGDFDKVTYKGDLNLCTQKKEDLAPYLFDGTLNRFFAGRDVQLILESANKEYVDNAIEFANAIGLTGAVIQTKSGTPKEEARSQVYPQPEAVNKEKREDLPIPESKSSELAQPKVAVQNTAILLDALVKVGVFNTSGTENNTNTSEEKEQIKPKGLTN